MSTTRDARVRYERARYTWMTTGEFAAAIGATDEHVRQLIESGWFRRDLMPPECLDVRGVEAKIAEYRIHPTALQRYYRERAA